MRGCEACGRRITRRRGSSEAQRRSRRPAGIARCDGASSWRPSRGAGRRARPVLGVADHLDRRVARLSDGPLATRRAARDGAPDRPDVRRTFVRRARIASARQVPDMACRCRLTSSVAARSSRRCSAPATLEVSSTASAAPPGSNSSNVMPAIEPGAARSRGLRSPRRPRRRRGSSRTSASAEWNAGPLACRSRGCRRRSARPGRARSRRGRPNGRRGGPPAAPDDHLNRRPATVSGDSTYRGGARARSLRHGAFVSAHATVPMPGPDCKIAAAVPMTLPACGRTSPPWVATAHRVRSGSEPARSPRPRTLRPCRHQGHAPFGTRACLGHARAARPVRSERGRGVTRSAARRKVDSSPARNSTGECPRCGPSSPYPRDGRAWRSPPPWASLPAGGARPGYDHGVPRRQPARA